MLFSRLSIIFDIISFFSVLHLGLSSAFPLLDDSTNLLTSRSADLETRLTHFTLRNMNFCNYTFNRNQCVLGTHYVEATDQTEIYLFNYDCLLIGWIEPERGIRANEVVIMSSDLPNVVTLYSSEWWPTFNYEGMHYGNPTCVEDSLGGASGCWQTFGCETREVVL